jgi:hypothetical protein
MKMGCLISKEIKNVVETTFNRENRGSLVFNEVKNPTGDALKDEMRARNYAKVVGMDHANTEMAVIMATQGPEAGAKAMIREFTTEENKFDYFAMRQRYG